MIASRVREQEQGRGAVETVLLGEIANSQ